MILGLKNVKYMLNHWGVSLCTKSSEGGAGNSYPSRQATIKFVLDMRAWRGESRERHRGKEGGRQKREGERGGVGRRRRKKRKAVTGREGKEEGMHDNE